MKFLWVRWTQNGIPCAQRFTLFKKAPPRKKRQILIHGEKFAILEANQGVELQVEREANLEEAAMAFVDAEGGQLSEYWTEK